MIKDPFCLPRLRAARKSNCSSPKSLLDRLREAVFCLIMLSANLSKHSNDNSPQPSDHYYYPNDHQHSEAVADCIEFIKKSACTSDGGRDSTTSHYADDSVAQVVVPLPAII